MLTLLARIRGWVARAVGSAPLLALGSGGAVAVPEYSPAAALSTMARFAWVWVCVRAVAGDLSSLPLVAAVRGPKGNRQLVDDPALALLANPSPGVSGTLFRKQLAVDHLLTGNAWIWVPGLAAWRAGGPYPVVMHRMHPAHVRAVVADLSQVVEYHYDDTSVPVHRHYRIPPGDVLHVSDVSWSDTVSSILGESVVRALHDELITDLSARELAAKQAKKGRPDVMFSATGQMDDKAISSLIARWERATQAQHGAFAVGNGVTATTIAFTPKEIADAERQDRLRDKILAVFEVTPARAGLVTANYGTDRQQSRTYWSSIQRRSTAWSEVLTRLARPGVRIEHDLSDVEALQVSYSERLGRVQTWVALGAGPRAAAAYEGFDEAPVPDVLPAAGGTGTSAAPRTDSEDGYQGDRRSAEHLELHLRSYLRHSATRWQDAAAAELGLLTRLETERLYAHLVLVQVPPTTARLWAEETVAVTEEAVRGAGDVPVAELRAFSPDRAARLARQIRRAQEAA